jgi:shikimate O-hydroxycinnamoyltransferase
MPTSSRIPLTPIDHIFTGRGAYPIEFVFAYRRAIDPERLRSSFRAILEQFPPASSKLLPVSDHSYAFEPAEDGARLETLDADATFDDASRRREFLDPVDSVPGEPLTRVRLTRTPRGSVLGVSMSHAVADGFSYFLFLSMWARLFHGKKILPAFHDREVLLPKGADDRTLEDPESIREASGVFLGGTRPTVDRARMVWDRRLIGAEELGDLLAQSQHECDIRLTHNDVVTAQLWRDYAARWNTGDDSGPAYLNCPVDFRRIHPRCPANYFGCAVSLASTALSHDQLARASNYELALTVRSAVSGVGEERIRLGLGALERLRRQQGRDVLEKLHVMHPDAGLLVTNISRLPVLEIEFDAGPPVEFDILTPVHRGAVVLPASDGLDVRVCYLDDSASGSNSRRDSPLRLR